jgi:hypothetical protein
LEYAATIKSFQFCREALIDAIMSQPTTPVLVNPDWVVKFRLLAQTVLKNKNEGYC